MSDREEIRIGENVCDAVPDPPRISNAINHQNINLQDESEKLSSGSDSSSNKSTKVKDKIPKKETKKPTAQSTVNNFNIIGCNGLTVGNTFYFNNFNGHSSTKVNQELKQMSTMVQALSTSRLQISTDDMLLIKMYIGRQWKKFAKKILPEGRIDQIEEDFKSEKNGEVIYQLLLDWQRNDTSNATVGRAICALWSSGEYDCAERLAKLHT